MLGAIIGDFVGSRFEFKNHKNTDFEFFHPDCAFTDDTICTVAVADWLMNQAQDLSEVMRRWCQKYPSPEGGYGLSFRKWIFSTSGPYNSFGNGSAMRVSPVAWWASDIGQVNQLAERSAQITHDHAEGIKGAQCIAEAIFRLRSGQDKKEIKRFVHTHYYNTDQTCDQIRATNQFDETCQVTVPQAIQCFLESTDFESAIRLAVSIGGDTDTIAAITGSLAEAAYSVPEEMTRQVFRILPDDMIEVINRFTKIAKPAMSKNENQTGEQLFELFSKQKSEYASLVKMLPYAAGSMERAFQILEQCQAENKRLYAYYPGVDVLSPILKKRLESMDPIGSIIDGCLYLVPARWKADKE